ncbi:DUF4833 domain-containing protein [Dyadobacter frigoris]|uniref:DUF4833 domain-containing protein n=1 Tax=Dyadobacter frigoris TaxID=2576211 RepID=A0A4V6BLL4_9BACT|nr:DUF4833 domain-containing protein [Dyadobacter frigoris]TKT90843.1 DUF4833 domain-containing protein [Dyadobacter frigoris]GLU52179.1 hypothetical protein Dfri01_16400 [Dyadobacter frigoris]
MRFLLIASLIAILATGSNTFADKKSKENLAVAAVDTFPVPKLPNLLFYIQRDPNTNTICYELNVNDKGQLDEENPVHPFWIRYPEGGGRKELNYLQKKFAYGIIVKKAGKDYFQLKSVAYSKTPLYLKKGTNNKYQVYMAINQKQCVLTKIFVRIEGGTFWVPNVRYIEVTGTDPATGKTVVERISKFS